MGAIFQLWYIIRMLILSSYVLLESINTIYKFWSRLGDLVRRILGFQFLGPGALYYFEV